ncbi:DNA-binding transcription repressor ASH1 Ecym_3236 [Eremothecium cymbalariae DBVPG|uniref:GATA-type domain-containing protein n=1 Tax=Eremothecium cymbalariae (strain CBS 270.75 / DBVPG 7215 / KCTC 17166 / NRRL Y-17582) TaxID=931890 RepID=G8JRG1_ERECY|nr:Hypothetical protein Ecym_3236 [Eremothecium cymbalariae DBVPG\
MDISPTISLTETDSDSSSSEIKRKWSFDELLLPSLQTSKHSFLSAQESPYFFNVYNNKSMTAPSSPKGLPAITPNNSPKSQFPGINPYSASSMTFNPSSTNENNSIAAMNVMLPTLKNLKLLPNPNIQNHSRKYPDTSERTQFWRQNLISWCRKSTYQQYKQIEDEVASMNPARHQGLHILANTAYVSSVLSPKDQFYQLSNSSVNENIVITPPVSPRNDQPIGIEYNKFNPAVSEKLVQTIRKKRLSASTHKKSNSCQARELKKLLETRSSVSPGNVSSSHNTSAGRITKISKAGNSRPSSPPHHTTVPNGNTLPPGTEEQPDQRKIKQSISPTANSKRIDSFPSDTLHVSESMTPQNAADKLHRVHQIIKTDTKATSMTPLNFQSSDTHTASSELSRTTSVRRSPTSSLKSPGRKSYVRKCLSCHCTDSPCWRPSWSDKKQDQLCNSCGLRYKKTHTRCLNAACRKIPSKGELTLMKTNPLTTGTSEDGYVINGLSCLFCGNIVTTQE